MIIRTPRLVVALGGPLAGRWFTADDWAVQTDLGRPGAAQDAPAADYVPCGTVTHPVTGALGTAMHYQRSHDDTPSP